MRADAQVNRERILEIARELLDQFGDVSLNTIAKAARVGAGTLYRHFPNRETLLLAVYQDDVQRLVDRVPQLLESNTAAGALRRWFIELATAIRIKHGLPEVFHSNAGAAMVADTYAPVLDAIGQMLNAGANDGSIRTTLDPNDLLLMMGFLWRIAPGPEADLQAERMLDFVFRGLLN